MTGVFSSRKIEKAACERNPVCHLAGGLHPEHDVIAKFRKKFLAEIQELFVQPLLVAQSVGVRKLGNLGLDGSKMHANVCKMGG